MTALKALFIVGLISIAAVDAQCHSPYRQIGGALIHATTSVNYIWGVNGGHNIYRCNRPCRGAWVHIAGGLKQIDASDDEVWGVNKHDHIFKRPVDGSGSWKNVGGRLKHVSASGNGYIWGVNAADQIFKCKKPCNGAWKRVGGALKQIDGGDQYVYGVNAANDLFARPVDGSGVWRHIPGLKLKYVTGSGATEIFGVGVRNQVYSCEKPCIGNFKLLDGNLMQLDATFDSFIGVSAGNEIHTRNTGV